MTHLLLLSGGLDSTTIHALKKSEINECIYFDYGQRSFVKETEIIGRLGIAFTVLPLVLQIHSDGYVDGRNLEFVLALRKYRPRENLLIYFGNCADDNYPDNSREYLYRVESVINSSFPASSIRIICPLENMTKREIVHLHKNIAQDAPYYFCDTGAPDPCGKCHSCEAMISAGVL